MSVDFDVVDALAGFAEDLHGEGNFAMRLHDAVKRLKEERDEARAEVERLRVAFAGAENSITAHVEHEARLRAEASELAQEAYQRGAEAMREAAAKEVFAFYAWSKDNEATRTDIKNLAELIDALPVPEDKP